MLTFTEETVRIKRGGRAPTPSAGVPYSIPSAGNALFVSGPTNATAESVRPTSFLTAGEWNFTLHAAYGTGVFCPGMGTHGKYVIAGTGGHASTPNVGAAIWDAGTGEWSRKDNSSGLDWRASDFTQAETNGSPWYEVSGTSPLVPAPGHSYGNMYPHSSTKVGFVIRSAVCTVPVNCLRPHTFDIVSGDWARISATNEFGDVDGSGLGTENLMAFVDPARTNRVYICSGGMHNHNRQVYLDLDDSTYKELNITNAPPDYGTSVVQFGLHPTFDMLVAVYGDGTNLRGLDLSNPTAGWQALTVSGTFPPTDRKRLAWHSTRGRFYMRVNAASQTMYRLTPPASSPFSNTWTFDTETLGGDTIPAYANGAGDGNSPISALVYAPAIDCLVYFAHAGVAPVLINPAA